MENVLYAKINFLLMQSFYAKIVIILALLALVLTLINVYLAIIIYIYTLTNVFLLVLVNFIFLLNKT